MYPFALTKLGRIAGHHPLRGIPRLLYRSYANAQTFPPPTVTTTLYRDRLHIDFRSYLEWHLWAFGTYEQHIWDLCDRLVSSGDTVIDLGANVGIHTIRLANLVGSSGQVIAVEAAADLCQRLQANLELNCLSNIIIHNAAATDRSGEAVTLHRPASSAHNEGRSSLFNKPSLTGASEQVRSTRLDALVESTRPIRLLKIDVEGAESMALLGAEEILKRDKPAIICEVDSKHTLSVKTYLSRFGYSIQAIIVRPARLSHRQGLALTSWSPSSRGAVEVLALHTDR